MNWTSALPRALLEQAYQSSNEMAWRREAALSVVKLLRISGYTVLGVDIWLATKPGPTIPTPIVYDWDIDQPDPKPGPEQFIAEFSWDKDDIANKDAEPFFNLTIE